MTATGARDLRPLFDPRSVAVVGASADPAKWGHWLARGALAGEHRRAVHLVNSRGAEVLGRPTLRSLGELEDGVELVALAVPASAFEKTVDAALGAGARAIVAISAGLGELGEEGKARERAVVERVRAAGAVLLGPNCNGVLDTGSELELGFDGLVGGPIGLVSQSGNLCYEIALLAADAGLGVSRVASVGNQADLDAADLVAALDADPATRVIAVYAEDFRDGRAFARAAHAAATPVVLLPGGRSAAGVRAALSHTGALASDLAAVEAACRAAGIVRVSTPKELVDVCQLLLARRPPRGRRMAIVADGGGTGIVAADVAASLGLEVPVLGDRLRAELASGLPPTSVTANPVDLAGAGEQDFRTYDRVVSTVAGSGEVDAVLLVGYLGGYSGMGDELRARELDVAGRLAAANERSEATLACQLMYASAPPARALRTAGVPVYRDVEGALRSIALVAERAASPARGVPDAVAAPADGGPSDARAADYFEARELLASAGIPLVEARRAADADEAVAVAAELGYPVVLKALGLVHKSDAGGVAVGLADEGALRSALAGMQTRLSPPGYSVERTAPVADGVELIVGCRRDARFGPLVLVGLGGLFAEVLRDVAVALAPAEPAQLEELIGSLSGAALLAGARGRGPVDVAAAARAAAALSRLAAERPDVAEAEVNPLLATPDGAVGLDARAVLAPCR